MKGGIQIRAGIITPDPVLAVQLRQDLAQFGFTAIGDGSSNGELADVILLDCRASTTALEDYDHLKGEKIILPIIEAKTDLPIADYSEFTDIICYPYTKEELYVRISLAAFRNKLEYGDDVFEIGGFKINFTNYEVTIDSKPLDLTYKEYELLRHMASAPGRVFTRSQLLKNVWGYDYIEGARTVDVHIRRLRSKLGTKYSALIETVRHVGYRFKRLPV